MVSDLNDTNSASQPTDVSKKFEKKSYLYSKVFV